MKKVIKKGPMKVIITYLCKRFTYPYFVSKQGAKLHYFNQLNIKKVLRGKDGVRGY
jgi:hypothetical protein